MHAYFTRTSNVITDLHGGTRTLKSASVNIRTIYCAYQEVQRYPKKRNYLTKISNNTAQQRWRKSHLDDRTKSKRTSFWGTFWRDSFFSQQHQGKETDATGSLLPQPEQIFLAMTEKDFTRILSGIGENSCHCLRNLVEEERQTALVEGRSAFFPSFVSRERRSETLEWHVLTGLICQNGKERKKGTQHAQEE